MRLRAWFVALAAGALLAGCAAERRLQPGVHDAAAVRAEMGAPGEVIKTAQGGEIWFYPRGRVGRETFRAELDPGGKLLSLEQVLHEGNFDRIVAGKTTGAELRALLGPPNEEWVGMNRSETIWDYRYRWGQSLMVVHFGVDQKGLVTGQFRRSERDAPSVFK